MNTPTGIRIACAFVAMALSTVPALIHARAVPSEAQCASRVNDTADKVVECIRKDALWDHMIAFQEIAYRYPGADGHPSRNGGEQGYKTSIDYVARLMTRAGYAVTIQTFTDPYFSVVGTPRLSEQGATRRQFEIGKDWYVAYNSGAGTLSAPVQPAGGVLIPDTTGHSQSGCSAADFAGFVSGRIALIQRGGCPYTTKVANAQAAGAVAVIVFNEGNAPDRVSTPDVEISSVASLPVFAASYALGADLCGQYTRGLAPVLNLDVHTTFDPNRQDYNLIAESRLGDPNHVVVIDAHLDAIFGAGMLDNASGSTSILEVALKMAKTPTLNKLRFIWFGGEEIGLYGSWYYVSTLAPADLSHVVFDIDADVTGTPNYVIATADPANSFDAANFPANVVPASQLGNGYFAEYFAKGGLPLVSAPFGNDGTDSNSFSYFGVPNSGILTGQGCCKEPSDVSLWGGYIGNLEGRIPSEDGGCVDYEGRWCDNLWENVDPYVLEMISKAVGYVTFKIANDVSLNGAAVPSAANAHALSLAAASLDRNPVRKRSHPRSSRSE